MKQFQAECIVADNIDDPGQREHISDLIQFRENKKKEKSSISPSVSEEMHIPDKNEVSDFNTYLIKDFYRCILILSKRNQITQVEPICVNNDCA